MTPTLLIWFRIAVVLLMAYTVYTYIRSCIRRGYWVPKSAKDLLALGGDLLTLAGGVFIWFMITNNYQKPMEKVMENKQQPFPELSFYNIASGNTSALSQYRGKLVLLNLWATWCPPCRAEMPALDNIQKTFKDRGLVVLAVSDEDPATVKAYLQEHPYSFSVGVFSGNHTVLNGVNTRPATILISPEGKVIDMVVGARGESFFSSWVEEQLKP